MYASCPDPGRQQKPVKLKRIAKLKDQEVAFSACGAHSSALVTRDGKLYLFGSSDEDITDKGGGVHIYGDSVCIYNIYGTASFKIKTTLYFKFY